MKTTGRRSVAGSAPGKAPRSPKIASPRYEDPRFDEVVAAFAADRRLAPAAASLTAPKAKDRGGKFGSNALKVNGKIFAMAVKGRLVVKLAKARADQLVGAGDAAYFDPGHGRLMKQWVAIANPKLPWIELAREAHDFVAGGEAHRVRISGSSRPSRRLTLRAESGAARPSGRVRARGPGRGRSVAAVAASPLRRRPPWRGGSRPTGARDRR